MPQKYTAFVTYVYSQALCVAVYGRALLGLGEEVERTRSSRWLLFYRKVCAACFRRKQVADPIPAEIPSLFSWERIIGIGSSRSKFSSCCGAPIKDACYARGEGELEFFRIRSRSSSSSTTTAADSHLCHVSWAGRTQEFQTRIWVLHPNPILRLRIWVLKPNPIRRLRIKSLARSSLPLLWGSASNTRFKRSVPATDSIERRSRSLRRASRK